METTGQEDLSSFGDLAFLDSMETPLDPAPEAHNETANASEEDPLSIGTPRAIEGSSEKEPLSESSPPEDTKRK